MANYNQNKITVKGQEIPYYRIDNDVNGNPRYVAHFMSLGVELDDYGKVPGLTKYRGKWFGGGYVFQSYNLENTFEHALDTVKEFYHEDIAASQSELAKEAQKNIRKEAPWILGGNE